VTIVKGNLVAETFSEIEVKYNGGGVSLDSFLDWCLARRPVRYERIQGPDVYYEQGDNVVRHRHQAGVGGEITVKKRKGARSITDRLEINLRFEAGTSIDAVDAFLRATGWTPAFKLAKDAHIFWFESGQEKATVVIYQVARETLDEGGQPRLTDCKRFVEVEIESSSNLSERGKKDALRRWRTLLIEAFPELGEPLNDSLYEIYSGKRYLIMNKMIMETSDDCRPPR
jgi:hypothetical protein